jgi:hypothetical protein
MGPGEPPLLPNFEFLTASEDQVFVKKFYHECNYLQGNEGNYDLIHLSFLHHNKFWDPAGPYESQGGVTFSGRGVAPGVETVEAEIAEFGVRICKVRKIEPDKKHLYLGTFIFPNAFAFSGPLLDKGYGVNWHVPIDDTRHWLYDFTFSREKPIDKDIQRSRAGLTEDYRLVRNRSNRYLQDRASMKTESFTGIKFSDFNAHDLCVVEGAGPIQDRTREHLVSSDAPIVAARKLLLKAIKDIQEGHEPPFTMRDPQKKWSSYVLASNDLVPNGIDWRDYFKRIEGS